MKKRLFNRSFRPVALLLLIYTPFLKGQDTLFIEHSVSELYQKLTALSDTSDPADIVIYFRQPISHFNSEAGYFDQRVYLHHRGFDRPMVFNTEGYSAQKANIESLTRRLGANQIVAEHRYFGESVPDSSDWRYLNIRESAGDQHRIITVFRDIYRGKWITMGISKGGQTAMYHRRFYPDDVDATVCFVAPLNFSDREPRIDTFLKEVGGRKCRDRIFEFQQILLQRKDELLPLFLDYARKKDYTFSIGPETAYEYCVLEIPFAFWQWQKVTCAALPTVRTSLDTILKNFIEIASPYYFSDAGIRYYTPFFHQALNEIGYYAYDPEPFDGLIQAVSDPTFRFNAPDGTQPEFDSSVMYDIAEWLKNTGRRMIFIYGGYDPWGASAVDLGENPYCLKMVLPGGSHATRIEDFPPDQQTYIYDTLGDWLDMQISTP